MSDHDDWRKVPYHMAIPDPDWPDEYITLCGSRSTKFAYVPAFFASVDRYMACPQCLEHPDFPLLLLGET